MQKQERLSVRKSFVRYAVQGSLGMLALSCYILADTFFIAQGVGADGLTALNLALPVYSFVYGTGLMLGMGGAAQYSIHQSRGQQKKADGIFSMGLLLLGGAAAFYLLMGLFFSNGITRLLGADAKVYEMTHTYLRVIFLFSPFFMTNNFLLAFVRNDGAPHLAMAGMIAGSFGNVILDYIFIFPLGMGIFGAVLATGCAPVMSILILSPYLLGKKRSFHWTRPDWGSIPKLLATGLPSLLSELSSGIVIIVFNFLILRLLGNTGVAAYGVIANLSLVVVAIYTGVSQGVQPLISRAYGEGKREVQRVLLQMGFWTIVGVSALLYAGIFFGASPIAAVFNSARDPLLQQTAEEGLKLYFTGAVFAGVNILLSTTLAAVDRAVPAQIVAFLRGFGVIIPMAFLLSAVFGMMGIWLSFPAAEGITAVAAVFLLQKKKWA